MWQDQTQPVRAQLGTGEHLLWTGQPRRGLMLKPSDAFMIPFSLLWGGFAIFWETTVILSGAPFFFRLWGVPFVLVGLYLIAGRFFYDAWRRARTFYGVTNERVIIVTGKQGRHVQSVNLDTLGDMTLDVRPDGRGTITFGAPPQLVRWAGGASQPFGNSRVALPAFEAITDAKKVYETIRSAQRQLGSARGGGLIDGSASW